MRIHFLQMLLLIALVVQLMPVSKAAPAIDQGQLAVSGTWQPETIDADTAGKWMKHGDRLRITFPKDTNGEFGITAKEPLPAGDWTADFWFVQYDDLSYVKLTIALGTAGSPGGPFIINIDPSSSRAEVRLSRSQLMGGGGYINSGGGRVHWLRLVYQGAANQVAAYLNGEEIRIDNPGFHPPTSPVIVRAKMPYKDDHEVALEFAGYTVTPDARPLSAAVPGLAQRGWVGEPLVLAPEIRKALAELANAPALTNYGRAYAHSAHVLATRAGTPTERSAAWAGAMAYLAPLIEQDPKNAAPLLAVMTASVPAEERAAVDPLITRFKARVAKPTAQESNAMPRLMAHTALFDPAYTVVVASRRMQSHSISPIIIGDLVDGNPALALSARCQFLNSDNADMAKNAWFLPELRDISPNYYQLTLDILQGSIGRKLFKIGEPDRSLSYAAWRLAPVDFPNAMALCAGITVPEVKADTFQAISDLMEGHTLEGADEQIEAALLDAIAQFVPTQRNDSPGREIMRLVRWYEGKGRHTQAMNALGQAKKRISATPSTAFRDTYAIYRFLLDVKDPEAAAWLDKSIAAASAADQDQEDYQNGGIYMSATVSVVRNLARDGRIDDALAAAEKLNIPGLEMNYSNALAAVLYAVAATDVPRALELIAKMPDDRQRTSSINGLASRLATRDPKTALGLLRQTADEEMLVSLSGALAPELAKEDPKAALALIDRMPVAQRTTALIRICATLPAGMPEFTSRCGEAVKAKFAEYRARPASGRDHLMNELESLPVRTLLAMQPYFGDEMDAYARTVCVAIARESGVVSDPLWQRLSMADRPKFGQVNYWGCTYLRDAISQWKRDQGQ